MSSINFFQPQYDNEIVCNICKKYNITEFYYLAVFQKLKIFINNDSQNEPLEMELNYDNNCYLDLIKYISERCQCDPKLIKVFVNNKNLDEVDQNLDMKKYKETGLIAYTNPIEVQPNKININAPLGDDNENEDPFEKGNGTYEANADLPDTEYVFKFKELNEEPFKLQLPKDVTVKDVKDKISERNSVDSEDITIFVGNHRLADFNILTALVIPKTMISFNNSKNYSLFYSEDNRFEIIVYVCINRKS